MIPAPAVLAALAVPARPVSSELVVELWGAAGEARVRLLDPGARAVPATEYGAQRRFTLTVPGCHWLWVGGDGARAELSAVDWDGAEEALLVRVDVPATTIVRVHVRTRDGAPFPPLVSRGEAGALDEGLAPVAVASREPFERLELPAEPARVVRDGVFARRLATDAPALLGRLELVAEPPLTLALVVGDAVVASLALEAYAPDVELELDVEDVLAATYVARFRLVDAELGTPVTHGAGLGLVAGEGRPLLVPDVLDVPLRRPRTVVGRVARPEDASHAVVSAYSKRGGGPFRDWWTGPWRVCWSVDEVLRTLVDVALEGTLPIGADGRFAIELAPRDQVLIARVDTPGGVLRSPPIAVAADETGPVDLPLVRAVPLVLIVPPGRALGYRVEQEGRPEVFGRFPPSGEPVSLDLAPGHHLAEIVGDDGRVHAASTERLAPDRGVVWVVELE